MNFLKDKHRNILWFRMMGCLFFWFGFPFYIKGMGSFLDGPKVAYEGVGFFNIFMVSIYLGPFIYFLSVYFSGQYALNVKLTKLMKYVLFFSFIIAAFIAEPLLQLSWKNLCLHKKNEFTCFYYAINQESESEDQIEFLKKAIDLKNYNSFKHVVKGKSIQLKSYACDLYKKDCLATEFKRDIDVCEVVAPECGKHQPLSATDLLLAGRFNTLTIEQLKSYSGDLMVATAQESNSLYYAATNGQFEIVKELIKKNLPINKQRVDGDTALMAAASNGHLDIVKLLSENGAANLKDKNGFTAMDYAAESRYARKKEIVLFLVDKFKIKN